MRHTSRAAIAGICAIACMVIVSSASGSVGIQAYVGDTVPLSGYSYGSQSVYLFLTGPNLPANGVALNDITARADQGHFTRVDVDDNDRWVYKWNTASVGGRLDTGTYTVWVVNGPNDRSRLSEADYSTISIRLGTPGITVSTPAIPGTLLLRSTPEGASITLNDEYRGRTPLTIGDLQPGSYTVTFSCFGYAKLSKQALVESGRTTEVSATLAPETGALMVNTSPSGAGARLMLDGVDAGIAPVTLTNITVGNHTLTASKEGYATTEQSVRVIADQIVTADIVLAPAAAAAATPSAAENIPVAFLACCAGVLLVVSRRSRSKR